MQKNLSTNTRRELRVVLADNICNAISSSAYSFQDAYLQKAFRQTRSMRQIETAIDCFINNNFWQNAEFFKFASDEELFAADVLELYSTASDADLQDIFYVANCNHKFVGFAKLWELVLREYVRFNTYAYETPSYYTPQATQETGEFV